MSEWRDPWIAMAPLGASVWASGVSVGRVSVSLVAGVAGNWPKIHLPNPCSLKSSSCRSGNTSCFLHRSYLGPSCCRSYFLTGSSDSDNLFNAVAFGWCWKAEKSAYSIQEHPLIASDVAHVKFLILKQPASHISFAASPSAISHHHHRKIPKLSPPQSSSMDRHHHHPRGEETPIFSSYHSPRHWGNIWILPQVKGNSLRKWKGPTNVTKPYMPYV